MTFTEKLKTGRVVLDGATGTLLQKAGLQLGELPEEWNIKRPEVIEEIHESYLKAGSDVISANTFGANIFKFGERTEEIISSGVKIAKKAAARFENRFVALDIGPTGKLLKPLGELEFEEAVSCFKKTVSAGVKAGADLIIIETMNDIYEMKAALLAAKEECSLPVIVTCVFDESMQLLTGADPETVVAICEGLGADAVGLNCSLGPQKMIPAVEKFIKYASLPVAVQPNAGLPREENGVTFFDVTADEFANEMQKILSMGASIVGGCCGTTPEYIEKTARLAHALPPYEIKNKNLTVVSSNTHSVYFGGSPVLIGERINPTGKKRLKEALREKDMAYILGEAVSQKEKGVHVLDVNVGLPEIDEKEMLSCVVREIQAVTDLPLQIDTSNAEAMEKALRVYNGKPLINSVNGKQEVMDEIFPLVKKYGGAVIALTLDEDGIPATAQGRIRIAQRIVREAQKYGIQKKNIIFDTLAMAVSADSSSGKVCIDSLKYIREEMGINTSLGVSNISFGLPNRDFINSTFFAMCLSNGLSAAIMNPNSQEMMKTYFSFCALSGNDEKCLDYINFASAITAAEYTQTDSKKEKINEEKSLKYFVEKGIRKKAEEAAEEELKTKPAMEIINGEIIPALDEVGKLFENKKFFLPQLLMSAEAAAGAFEVIKKSMGSTANVKKLKIILATVKGDIHDIGKNIVKTILENYGFCVTDLGRDVQPEAVVQKAIELGADVVGLSALMTTTVKSMEDTIKLLNEKCPACKTVVGGAVLTEDYAKKIGADKYAHDAMETVRFCEKLEGNI